MISQTAIMGVSDAHICAVDERHFLQAEVRDAFSQMQNNAREQGLDLKICSSFRSFDKQLSIWNRKWLGELPLYTLSGDSLTAEQLSPEEKIHAIMLWSALPGASRHHWGTDFDFFDKRSIDEQNHDFQLVSDEYENNGPCAKLSDWVHANASHYGFYHPYAHYVGGVAQEPWHISYQAIAKQIESNFDIKALSTQLRNSNILGKETILPLLEYLVERYTYNRGVR
jgi:LAS superfamily LD-carboxypeptidase LdcB